jgi:hypothetical protein
LTSSYIFPAVNFREERSLSFVPGDEEKFVFKPIYTPSPLTGHPLPDSSLSGQMGFLVIRTHGCPDNEFRREVPVNRTVRISGTECIVLLCFQRNHRVLFFSEDEILQSSASHQRFGRTTSFGQPCSPEPDLRKPEEPKSFRRQRCDDAPEDAAAEKGRVGYASTSWRRIWNWSKYILIFFSFRFINTIYLYICRRVL